MILKPGDLKTSVFHSYMLAAIAPRPIAFASTIDKDGNPNLSPFSFFNAFGSNPPTLIFSPARRVRDNSIKHTLENVFDVEEVVINVVTYSMVQQMSLSSSDFPKGVNEFTKAGFTPLPSEMVKPFRVKESPVQMECKVVEVKPMGDQGGAANLIICEILLIHIDDAVLNAEGKIDPDKLDLVARMGGELYCRASGNALFEVPKPPLKPGIGVDAIPESIRFSTILTGNNLGQLGNYPEFPSDEEVLAYRSRDFMKELKHRFGTNDLVFSQKIHELAKTLLDKGHVKEAWLTLLSAR